MDTKLPKNCGSKIFIFFICIFFASFCRIFSNTLFFNCYKNFIHTMSFHTIIWYRYIFQKFDTIFFSTSKIMSCFFFAIILFFNYFDKYFTNIHFCNNNDCFNRCMIVIFVSISYNKNDCILKFT